MLSILVILTRQKHLLIVLLGLEAIILSIILLIPLCLRISYIKINILLILLLTLRVCEAGLGLSLIVSISRIFGSDIIKSLSINKC